jgi:chorismate--pyruvate lyase
LNAKYLDILTEKGSLTDLFTHLMGSAPILNCLSQGRGPVDRYESYVLGIPTRVFAHIREITMGTIDKDWLYARTVIPMATLSGRATRLKRMGTTPLGKILFGSLNAERVEMKLELVFADEVGLEEWGIPKNLPLWQRSSVFELETGPLFISEILLPDCPIYNCFDRD